MKNTALTIVMSIIALSLIIPFPISVMADPDHDDYEEYQDDDYKEYQEYRGGRDQGLTPPLSSQVKVPDTYTIRKENKKEEYREKRERLKRERENDFEELKEKRDKRMEEMRERREKDRDTDDDYLKKIKNNFCSDENLISMREKINYKKDNLKKDTEIYKNILSRKQKKVKEATESQIRKLNKATERLSEKFADNPEILTLIQEFRGDVYELIMAKQNKLEELNSRLIEYASEVFSSTDIVEAREEYINRYMNIIDKVEQACSDPNADPKKIREEYKEMLSSIKSDDYIKDDIKEARAKYQRFASEARAEYINFASEINKKIRELIKELKAKIRELA